MGTVDRALVAPPKLRASILAHRARERFLFPRAALPSDFRQYSSGSRGPSIGKSGRYSVNIIMDTVVGMAGLTQIAIRSQRRELRLVRARHIIFWLCRRYTDLSLPAIARHIGDRDHTTVMHGCRNVDRAIVDENISVSDDLHKTTRQLLASRWARNAR